MLRRLLVVLALGGVLLVPSSFGAATTSNLSGTVTQVPGGYKVTIKNEGPDTAKYVWIRGVKHTSCSANRGGGCAPGGDAFTVRAFWADFFAGETREVTIMTDVPLAANAGVELSTSDLINGPLVPAGKATGPPAAPAPCKCALLTVRVLPSSLKLRESGAIDNETTIRFAAHWLLNCTKGAGGCRGTIDFRVRTPSRWQFERGSPSEILCRGKCGSARDGSQLLSLVSELEAHERRGRVTLNVERTCGGKTLRPLALWIAFNRRGNIDLKKSKLG